MSGNSEIGNNPPPKKKDFKCNFRSDWMCKSRGVIFIVLAICSTVAVVNVSLLMSIRWLLSKSYNPADSKKKSKDVTYCGYHDCEISVSCDGVKPTVTYSQCLSPQCRQWHWSYNLSVRCGSGGISMRWSSLLTPPRAMTNEQNLLGTQWASPLYLYF